MTSKDTLLLPSLTALSLKNVTNAKNDDDDPSTRKQRPDLPPLPPMMIDQLPPDLLGAILAVVADPDADCKKIGDICTTNKTFNDWCESDKFWSWVCKAYGWNREDRRWTVWTWDASAKSWSTVHPKPWQMQYREWCARQLDDVTIREAVEHFRRKQYAYTSDTDHPFYGPVGCWDTSQVTNMSKLFKGALFFNGDVSNWTFPKVTDMSSMFEDAWRFEGNGHLARWTFPKVTNMSSMFERAFEFNADVSMWTFPNVTDMSFMFNNAGKFEGNGVSHWTFPAVTNMNYMFLDAGRFVGRFSSKAIADLRGRYVEIPYE